MRNRTEGVSADHVEHRLDDFATENLAENRRFLDASAFAKGSEKSLELLNSPNPMDSNPTEALLALILVSRGVLILRRVSLLKDEQAVVAEIFEVDDECFEEFVLFIFEEVFILLNKLSDDICEQGERVR